MSLLTRIQALAEEHQAEWVGIRRHLHAHPELSFEEHQTMAFVSATLTSWGVDHQTHVTGTGIVAYVRGKKPESRTVALRADMDALPITEANAVDYASTNRGVMHACGHDVHTTSLLGALRILQLTSDGWQGTVRCIFQPGEETIPGGAKGMVAAGVLKQLLSRRGIFGQHVFPDLPAGDVGVRGGAYMASADEIHLTVKGKEAMRPCRTSAGTPCWLRPTWSWPPSNSWPGCAHRGNPPSCRLASWKPWGRPTSCPTKSG